MLSKHADRATNEVPHPGRAASRLNLRPVNRAAAELATALAVMLKAATPAIGPAVAMGADRFVTDNQRDFPVTIAEVKRHLPSRPARSPLRPMEVRYYDRSS